MIIIDDVEKFCQELKEDAASNIKFYCVCDKWYAVDVESLTKCKYFKTSHRIELPLIQSLIDSFPPPRQPVDYVTVRLLKQQPVIMFEDPGFDDVYFRADGRHRIQGAIRLGLKSVPAVFIPRRIWGLFIIGGVSGRKVNFDIGLLDKVEQEAVPLSWDRPPNAGPIIDGYHYEPTFVLTNPNHKIEPPKSECYVSNAAAISIFDKPEPKQSSPQPKQSEVNMFRSNAGIVRFI